MLTLFTCMSCAAHLVDLRYYLCKIVESSEVTIIDYCCCCCCLPQFVSLHQSDIVKFL